MSPPSATHDDNGLLLRGYRYFVATKLRSGWQRLTARQLCSKWMEGRKSRLNERVVLGPSISSIERSAGVGVIT